MSKDSYLQKVVLMESVETDSGDIGSAEMYSVDIGSAETDILKQIFSKMMFYILGSGFFRHVHCHIL